MKKLFLTFFVICLFSTFAAAQTTAFNFQGRLNDGTTPANGRYDLQFKLYTAIAGGNQVGATLDRPNLNLVNGVFSTQLDFGAAAFNGGDRFLEISLRPTTIAGVAPNAFVILGARQQILSVPYAAKSLNATNADNATNSQNAVNSQNATNATNATTAQTAVNSQQLGGLPASRYVATDANGDVTFSGKTMFNGNVYQPAAATGLPKALVRLDRDGVILNCFNGVTGQSANNCGFTVNHTIIGSYTIDFGFVVSNRIIVGTSEYDGDWTTVSRSNGSSNTRVLMQVVYITDINLGTIGALTNASISVVVY